MLNDRPIRLTFSGEVESWNVTSHQWIRDNSRDPREFVTLGLPPSVPESLAVLKTTCVNSITGQLYYSMNAQDGFSGVPLEPGVWDNLAVGGFAVLARAGYSLLGSSYGSPSPPHLPEHSFFWNLAYRIGAEWAQNQIAFEDILADGTNVFFKKVLCHLWCFMSDDCTYSYVNWQEMIAAVRADNTLGDAQEWLRLMLIMLGRKGLTNLGYLKTPPVIYTLDPETDCTCS